MPRTRTAREDSRDQVERPRRLAHLDYNYIIYDPVHRRPAWRQLVFYETLAKGGVSQDSNRTRVTRWTGDMCPSPSLVRGWFEFQSADLDCTMRNAVELKALKLQSNTGGYYKI